MTNKLANAVVCCEPVEARRLLAAIISGDTKTGSRDATYSIDLTAGTDVLIATHVKGKTGDVNVSLVNPAIGSSVGYTVITAAGSGRTGEFRVGTTGTFELRIDIDEAASAGGKWSTTLFTRTSDQRRDDSDGRAVTGKTYGGRVSGKSDVDWWSFDHVQDAFSGAAFGPVNGASASDFQLAHLTPDGKVEIGQPGSNSEGWWTNARADNWIAGGKQYYVVWGKSASYSMSFTSLPDARDPSVDDRATIKSGQTYNGRITSGDQDVFPIQVRKGASISATLKAAKGSSLKPSLRLVRADGIELSADDDGDTARVSSGAARENTVYYLVARGGWLSNGKYDLTYKLSSGNGTGSISDRGVLQINGGSGHDKLEVTQSMSAGVVSVNLNGKVTEYARGAVRSLRVDSGDGNDFIDFSSTDLPSYVSAGSGNDTVLGGSGKDSFVGGAGKNRLDGGDGDDRLKGSNGPDTLVGAGGNDRLYGGAGDDHLDGGPGTDRLWGQDGNDRLIGGPGNDKIYAGRGRDSLWGNDGRDLLNGGPDEDEVFGRQSSDTLIEI